MISSRGRLVGIIGALALMSNAQPAEGQGRGQSRPEPGTLIIRNVAFDSVRIEVRIGASNNCEMNPMVGVRKLRKGRAWAVKADRGVCWRRELSPGSSAKNAWTDWSRRVVPARGVVKTTT